MNASPPKIRQIRILSPGTNHSSPIDESNLKVGNYRGQARNQKPAAHRSWPGKLQGSAIAIRTAAMDAGAVEAGATAAWMERHRQMYERATRHPFTVSIRDGTVDLAAFKRWLSQDYMFVREFVAFVASVLLNCRKQEDSSDMELILGGVACLSDDLSWFKNEAAKWGVDLASVSPLNSNLEYCRFLRSFSKPEISYAVAITTFWIIETVYQDSFGFCLEEGNKTSPELLGACQRWGSPEFKQYCQSLQRVADRCLANAPADAVKSAEEAFIRVLELEIGFWEMSSSQS